MNRNKVYLLSALFYLLIVIGTIVDLYHESSAELSSMHPLIEFITLLISVLGSIYFIYMLLNVSKKNKVLEAQVKKESYEKHVYKSKVDNYIQGLSKAIDDEFENWSLSPSEKRLGLLMLKGLSTKEIADLLSIKEKTVRTHYSSIYKKSGLNTKTELIAYFLEDLLIPVV